MFAVVTRIPTPESGGNLAAFPSLYIRTGAAAESNGWLGTYESAYERALPADAMLVLHFPVFTLGEIMVLDENGREIGGAQRKPSKWYIECEEFSSIEDAIKCVKRVMEETQ